MLSLKFCILIFIASKLTTVSSVKTFKLGVSIISSAGTPFDIERVGPAIHIATDKVNNEILNGSYKIQILEKPYGRFCSGSKAPGIVADLVKDNGIIGLIGPACTYALDPAAKLAAYWNIPVVTGFGDGGIFKNKTEYPTLTRLAYCQCRLRAVFGSVFLHFRWKNVAVIYDVNDLHSDVLASTLQVGLQKQQIYPKMFSYYGNQNTSFSEILLEVRKVTRVVLLIVPGESLRKFMLAAFDLGFVQTGEYVFMDVWLFPFPGDYWGNHDWQRNDTRNADAKYAFQALLRISLQVPTSENWKNFTNDVKAIAKSMYGFSFDNEEVNFFIGAFHDSVILFGIALNETLNSGDTVMDGYNFTRRMWNRVFQGVTGKVIMDDNGDRDTSYSMLDMDPLSGKFEVVVNFDGDSQYFYNPVSGKSVHWIKGSPPLDRPRCGYEGEEPECNIVAKTDMYITIFSLLIALVVLAFGVLFYRYKKREQDLMNDSWRVNYEDLEFNLKTATASCQSMLTANTDFSSDHSAKQQSATYETYKNVASYQVRNLQHDNLLRFVGASVEPSNICILYEFCRKGKLEDLLSNDTMKLDWTFRLSLLKDIAKVLFHRLGLGIIPEGMKYLHNSALKFHGSLRSSNCVIDGRFVVKISGFGLPSFADELFEQSDMSRQKYHKLWFAPEHLRLPSTVQTGSKKGDVYSFAIIAQEIVTRTAPYDFNCDAVLNADEIVARVASKEIPSYRPHILCTDCPSSLRLLMERCWAEEPEDRPDFSSILKSIRKLMGGRDDDLIDSLLRRMERYTSNLEEIVEERTQQLAVEKKRSDELLYQILPQSVANELRQGKYVTPEWFDCVTIYFSDIVGFTELSGSSTPLEVISLLNDLYSSFDSVIEALDVYKVETIGDAYMVVSGLPVRNGKTHAVEICRLAMKLLEVISCFVIRHRPGDKLQLRIGIHSGPCVAGVVGLKMPRYCLFGDTVNTASRMESSGQANRIHVSDKTKEILDVVGNFTIEERGQINVKGKGTMTTYWLVAENPKT